MQYKRKAKLMNEMILLKQIVFNTDLLTWHVGTRFLFTINVSTASKPNFSHIVNVVKKIRMKG
jgi:hypothetical protein